MSPLLATFAAIVVQIFYCLDIAQNADQRRNRPTGPRREIEPLFIKEHGRWKRNRKA